MLFEKSNILPGAYTATGDDRRFGRFPSKRLAERQGRTALRGAYGGSIEDDELTDAELMSGAKNDERILSSPCAWQAACFTLKEIEAED